MKSLQHRNNVTYKTALVLTGLLITTMALFIGIRSAMAASLKDISVIHSDVITVGDLFDNVRNNADYVIGAAPQPGKDMTLNARTLYRIASALDLNWRPATAGDQITIRREANIVSYDMISDSLREALKNKGVDTNFNVELNNGKPSIVLPKNMPESVEVASLKYNPQRDYFQADLVAPSIDNPLKKISVSGQVKRLVRVPVFNTTLQSGDIIGANDIKMIDVEERSLQHDVIMKPDDLIGLTPRRIAYANKFILKGTLGRPQLVQRGESVTITFTEGSLQLTAKGKALQSGAKGDIVRVTNANSSRTVDAIVSSENQVIAR